MSIASQITRLQNIKTAIKNALVTKGVPATDHDMEDFPQDIMSIATQGIYQSKTVSPTTTQQVVLPDSGYDALVSVTVNGIQLQSKSVTPSGTAQTVTPDNDKDGLSSVSVGAIQTQTKSATPSTTAQTITPDSGKYLSSVSVSAIQTQTKSASPSTSAQTITPDSGKYLTSVTIDAATKQSKTVSPSTSSQTVSPDSGYYGLSQVTVNAIQTQTKSATPTTSAQTITPDSGKYLTSVSISAATKQSKIVTPTTSQQIITPDSGYYGLSQVTVKAASPPVLKFYLSWISGKFQSTPMMAFNYDDLSALGYNYAFIEDVSDGYRVDYAHGVDPVQGDGWSSAWIDSDTSLDTYITSTSRYFWFRLRPSSGSSAADSYCTVTFYKL